MADATTHMGVYFQLHHHPYLSGKGHHIEKQILATRSQLLFITANSDDRVAIINMMALQLIHVATQLQLLFIMVTIRE